MLEEYSSAYQFQFTPLREGRHQRCEASVFGKYFNSRPSARGDARHLVNARNGVHFNSRPSARGDTEILDSHKPEINFNSRPSARGDTEILDSHKPEINFNSRPSARGDSKRYAISANLLFNPYKSAWLNNRATQFVEIILVIFHRIIA